MAKKTNSEKPYSNPWVVEQAEKDAKTLIDKLMARFRRAFTVDFTAPSVPFTEKDIKKYLDRCIRAWKNREKKVQNLEDALVAETYLEALQSVKEALFGKIVK